MTSCLLYPSRLDPKIAAQLELARQKANQVALRGGLSALAAAKLGVASAGGSSSSASRTAAELAADRLNAKLGYSRSDGFDNDENDGSPSGGAGASASNDYVRRCFSKLN